MSKFEPTEFGLEIFRKRYALHDQETWDEACKRLSRNVASAETSEKMKKHEEAFYEEIVNNRFMPGGRIWYGSGRPKGGLINCFVLEPQDSREGWAKAVSDMIVISGLGGGVGMNFSKVRPRGEKIHGTGGEATGAVSLMELINSVGEVIKGGGGRRVALMECLNIDHPDIPEFLDKKCFKVQKDDESVRESINKFFPRLKTDTDFQKVLESTLKTKSGSEFAFHFAKALHDKILQNANVSVVIPEGKMAEFIDAVRNDKEWNFNWRGETKSKIKARDLWKRIVDNAYESAEPGVLNFDLAEKMSNIGYKAKVSSTNPCGEIPMSPNEICCLGALVLPRFVDKDKVNWSQLADTITVAVRFLDNVLDVNVYPILETKEAAQKFRRIGLGVMGLHDMLLKLGYKYNSKEGLEFVDKLFDFIKKRAYEASCFLAAEKGAFPAYEYEGYSKSGFYNSLSKGLKSKIKHHGVRNCAVLSIAPTGTISIVCGVTSGVEPIFAYAYERRFYDNDEIKMEVVFHPLFKKFMDEGKNVDHFQSTYDLSVKDHLEIQRICQEHIDQAISKTINIPAGYPKEELYDLFLDYLPYLKGLTVYVDGSRGAAPLKSLSIEEASKIISCPNGVCDL